MNNESIILTSDDGSITLTNFRVIQRHKDLNKEIFLKDIVSNEVIRKKSKYYLVLMLIFGVLSLITLVNILDSENFEKMPLFYFLLVLFSISSLQYFFNSDKYLKISGKFNFIEFSIKNIDNVNLNKFRNYLLVESENQKAI